MQRWRLRPATLLKKRLWHRCFPINLEKILRTTFLQNTSRRLTASEKISSKTFYLQMIGLKKNSLLWLRICENDNDYIYIYIYMFNPYQANVDVKQLLGMGLPLKRQPHTVTNTLKQFVCCCRRIVWVCLTTLWG